MGPGRSLLGAVNLEREQRGAKKSNSVPEAWYRAFKRWKWKKRAEAWDEAEVERRRIEGEQDRLEERERRRDLLKGYRGKIARAIGALNPEDARWGEVTKAVETLAQESRAEYDDEPTQRLEHTGAKGGPIAIKEVIVERPNAPVDEGE